MHRHSTNRAHMREVYVNRFQRLLKPSEGMKQLLGVLSTRLVYQLILQNPGKQQILHNHRTSHEICPSMPQDNEVIMEGRDCQEKTKLQKHF